LALLQVGQRVDDVPGGERVLRAEQVAQHLVPTEPAQRHRRLAVLRQAEQPGRGVHLRRRVRRRQVLDEWVKAAAAPHEVLAAASEVADVDEQRERVVEQHAVAPLAHAQPLHEHRHDRRLAQQLDETLALRRRRVLDERPEPLQRRAALVLVLQRRHLGEHVARAHLHDARRAGLVGLGILHQLEQPGRHGLEDGDVGGGGRHGRSRPSTEAERSQRHAAGQHAEPARCRRELLLIHRPLRRLRNGTPELTTDFRELWNVRNVGR